ncbi:MAG TPA: hypothetical protein VHX39_32435 [Acetobacteraceae bacterium]|jgi:DHA1 family bicyclomycin/chloramphenicol resistance-like MFS transporter|nr:hypothetical protein [Acetobacteraceae bacterium]
MAGLALYTVGSIGCAVSPGPSSFYACRALAAFGGAASIVIPRTLVFDLESGPDGRMVPPARRACLTLTRQRSK